MSYEYPHFIDKETGSERLCNLPGFVVTKYKNQDLNQTMPSSAFRVYRPNPMHTCCTCLLLFILVCNVFMLLGADQNEEKE